MQKKLEAKAKHEERKEYSSTKRWIDIRRNKGILYYIIYDYKDINKIHNIKVNIHTLQAVFIVAGSAGGIVCVKRIGQVCIM